MLFQFIWRLPMRSVTFALAGILALIGVAPAAAQQYTAVKTGNAIELRDTKADMYVPVVIAVGRSARIQVKGKDIVRTTQGQTNESFENGPGLNGMPLLAPFANRMSMTGFYANGKKYNFDME